MAMEKFDVNKIIEQYGIDVHDLAKHLFPNVKYPSLAFGRVLKGEANLDIEQVSILAKYIGITMADLVANVSWRSGFENGFMTLTKGDYKVEFNPNIAIIKIYKQEQLVDNVIADTSHLSFEEFINKIDNLIKQY